MRFHLPFFVLDSVLSLKYNSSGSIKTMVTKMDKKNKLTSGNPFKTLLLFSLPMILAVTLQQFYNICDSLIAGRLISDNALSAVSSTYPVTVFYLAIAVGFGVGANIITARYIGEKNYNNAKTAINTSLITIGVIALVLCGLGLALLKPILAPYPIYPPSSASASRRKPLP